MGKITAKELKKMKSEEVVKLAERLKIAGFTKMSRVQMEDAILEAQGSGVISTDDAPSRGDSKNKKADNEDDDPKPRRKSRKQSNDDEVELVYTGTGGSVTQKINGKKRRLTPKSKTVMSRGDATGFVVKFPMRFKIREI